MQNIIRQTNDFLLRYKINKLPLKIDDLGKICEKLGYSLLSYQESESVLKELGMYAYTAYPAFTIHTKEAKFVLFNSTLSTGTRIFAIAHEIGHVALQHNYHGALGFSNVDSHHEQEANAFAYQLIAPLCVLYAMDVRTVREIQSETLLDRKRAKAVQKQLRTYQPQPRAEELILSYKIRHIKHKTPWQVRIACLLTVAAVSVGLIAQRRTINDLKEQLDAQSDQTALQLHSPTHTDPLPDTVYVTSGGERYHKENCYHIKNSTAKSLSRTAAESNGYTPCKTCYK